MAKQQQTEPQALDLRAKTCRMGKIANNLENHGGEWVTAFTVPITGLTLTKDELNDFMRDKYCHASWFETQRELIKPMAWWAGESFALSGAIEAEELTLELSGERLLVLSAEEPEDPDDADDRGKPACRLSRIELTPLVGGLTELRFHLYLHPGVGKNNLYLQEHQHREVRLTLLEAHRTKDELAPQPQLALNAPEGNGAKQPATT